MLALLALLALLCTASPPVQAATTTAGATATTTGASFSTTADPSGKQQQQQHHHHLHNGHEETADEALKRLTGEAFTLAPITSKQLENTEEVKGPIHFIWRVPHHDEHTYHHKERVFSNGTLTQCCDGIVSLALACALVNNPHQQVWLWSEQEWTDELVRSRLVNSPRLFFKHFDISKEAAGMDIIIDAFNKPYPEWEHQSVVWSDVTRYLLMNNYGGSYIDADICQTRPLPDVPRPFLAQCPTKPKANFIPCPEYGLGEISHGDRCAYSTNGLFNVPKGFWLFNHTLTTIAKQRRIVGRFFNSFGPLFLTVRGGLGMEHGYTPPYVLQLRTDKRQKQLYKAAEPSRADDKVFNTNLAAPLFHFTVNYGDFEEQSPIHRFFCFYITTLGLSEAGGFSCDDVGPIQKPGHVIRRRLRPF